ncbi:MAG: FliM/FliN family flagellar motor switch protein [Spirochaetia bacterium]|nr:FliM/FliN family flagellar motor switch protein [Spirochaetia bacterium]
MTRTGTVEDARLRVEVVLGGTELTVGELSEVGRGSIIALESIAGEPVELRAGGRTVARGEVVVIDENFGIRVTELAMRSGAGS